MNRTIRWLMVTLLMAGAVWLLAVRGEAGGDKGPWQPLLPKDVYEELAKREAETIKTALDNPTDESLARAKLGAALIAALTLSGTDKGSAEDLSGVRERAIRLAQALTKSTIPQAKMLAGDLLKQKPDLTKKLSIPWDTLLTSAELMDHLRPKAKGGDGMHPDLQSNVKLKGALNGIEEKVRALGMKELNETGMKKEAKEMELMAYRIAVVGALTYNFAPPKAGKKDPVLWREYSLKMRDGGVELAAAAQKGDTAAVLKSSSNLYSSCTQCHGVFK
jgi:hypothetical protein